MTSRPKSLRAKANHENPPSTNTIAQSCFTQFQCHGHPHFVFHPSIFAFYKLILRNKCENLFLLLASSFGFLFTSRTFQDLLRVLLRIAISGVSSKNKTFHWTLFHHVIASKSKNRISRFWLDDVMWPLRVVVLGMTPLRGCSNSNPQESIKKHALRAHFSFCSINSDLSLDLPSFTTGQQQTVEDEKKKNKQTQQATPKNQKPKKQVSS